ncbi:hypothetical protein BRC81_06095 [Halobacteriales archaeon QS_1_68_20]|nr:MAG: hypothetical protein BRC81_06095 [Halobacteriales archaeon QS_1_68_20]
MKKVGTATAVSIGLAGTASANTTRGFDEAIDVSDVSGRVALADLVDERDVASLDVAVDPHQANLIISDDAITIQNISEDCCPHHDCCGNVDDCECECCVCESCNN